MDTLKFLALATALAACTQTPSSPTPSTAPQPASAPEVPATTATTPKPRMKASATTAAANLGTRPEGVGIAVGQPMPDAEVLDLKGAKVRLASFAKADTALLVVFYRGGWCPYCNFEIHDLTTAFPEFQKRHVLPVAISVDKPEKAAETRATYEIPFPVLSDSDLAAHEAFKVMHTASTAEVLAMRAFGIDVEAASGRDHHRFAVPALFLVDRTGVVRWSHADLDYKTRPTAAQLIEVINGFDPL